MAQTVGSGNTCSRIISGDRFQIGADFFTITAITGNGSASNGVSFTGTKTTGTYDVSAVYATQFSSGVVKLNGGYITPFACGTDTVTDGGYTYNTVQIGTQCWLKQNINKGTMLASVDTLPTNNSTVEKWCYNNDSAICDSEGGLYSWDEAMGYSTTAGAQGICPSGYHIPTDAQQHTLDSYLATGTCDANRQAWDCDPASTAIRVGGTSGFEGILTGFRLSTSYNTYAYRGGFTNYWSSTKLDTATPSAWGRYLKSGDATVLRYYHSRTYGFPVRCVMDSPPPSPASLYTTSTTATSVNSSSWSDIHSATVTETLNSANSYYSVSFDGRNSFKVYNSGWRVIASNKNSDTSGTEGVWYYRDNSSAWAAAYSNNANAAISQAVAAGANNQMAKAAIEGISDANWEATGGFTATLDVATTLYSASASNNPQVDNVSFSYDISSHTNANTASATFFDASGDSFAGNATTTSQDWLLNGNTLNTDRVGAKATFTTATATEIWAGLDYSTVGGILKATIDKGTSREIINYIDTYSAANLPNQKTLLATGLANSTHTVEIELTAKKNPLAQSAPLAYAADTYTKLLLHADGANASTTFTDSETTAKTVTAVGNAQISTAQSKLGGSSAAFDGTGDYLTIPDSDDFDFGSGAFTLDTWAYLDETMGNARGIFNYGGNTGDWSADGVTWQLITYTDSKLYFQFKTSSGFAQIASTNAVNLSNAWHHLAVVSDGSTLTLYIDGISVGSGAMTEIYRNTTNRAARLGSVTGGASAWKGYLDEFRISKGIARYPSNFNPLPHNFSLNYIETYAATAEVAAASIVGAADSGSETTMTDDQLLATEDYFAGYALNFTTGDNNGKTVYVTAFDASTDTLTFTPALSTAISNESYQLIPDGIKINSRATRGINFTESATKLGAEFGNSGNLPVDSTGKAKQGTWSSWVKPNFAYNTDSYQHYIFDTGLQRLYYDGADDKWHFSVYNGSDWNTITITSAAQSFAIGDSIYLAASWNATSGIKLWVNGAKVASALTWTAQAPTSDTLRIGEAKTLNVFDHTVAGLDINTDPNSTKWNSVQSTTPSIIKDGNIYKMWFTGVYSGTNRILYAESSDGKTWNVFDHATAGIDIATDPNTTKWNATNSSFPSVIKDGSTYKMWFSGSDGTNMRILYAESSDGKVWSVFDHAVAGIDINTDPNATKWNSTHSRASTVIKDGTTYKMWFGGNNGANWRIMYAESSDGKTWNIFDHSVAGIDIATDPTNSIKWNLTHSYTPTVIKDSDTY
ncbi:MAG: LamG-like jellyroll fold domain-containing protein, partial [Candidatus Gracilibacteria bacterium]